MKNFTILLLSIPVFLSVLLSGSTAFGQSANTSESINELGIILNTVGDEMNDDYVSTLTKLSEMGYTYIEGGYYGDSAEDYAELLQSLGLKSIAYGTNLEEIVKEPDSFIETIKTLKAPYLACYFPWHFGWETRWEDVSMEKALKAAEELNALGKMAKDAGVKLIWHNHELEFKQLENGKTAFDIIMENTSHELVFAELDVYWTTKGGGDPIEQIKKYPNRIVLLHFKDMDSTEQKSFACVGEGIIDFEPVMKVARENGVQHFIIEHDDPADGIHCAQIGFTTIHSLLTKMK